jgi:hypothetical protein
MLTAVMFIVMSIHANPCIFWAKGECGTFGQSENHYHVEWTFADLQDNGFIEGEGVTCAPYCHPTNMQSQLNKPCVECRTDFTPQEISRIRATLHIAEQERPEVARLPRVQVQSITCPAFDPSLNSTSNWTDEFGCIHPGSEPRTFKWPPTVWLGPQPCVTLEVSRPEPVFIKNACWQQYTICMSKQPDGTTASGHWQCPKGWRAEAAENYQTAWCMEPGEERKKP